MNISNWGRRFGPICGGVLLGFSGVSFYQIYSEVPRWSAADSAPWQIKVISRLPLKAVSRFSGWLSNLTIPLPLRSPIYSTYARIFNANLCEVSESSLHNYSTFGDFFFRRLKEGSRVFQGPDSAVLSPSDGTIVQFGRVCTVDGTLPDSSQECSFPPLNYMSIKGVTYSLKSFLGSAADSTSISDSPVKWDGSDSQSARFALENHLPLSLFSSSFQKLGSWWRDAKDQASKNSGLYYCIIYLAPGDYHRIHSPVPWVVERLRHFYGQLFSVSPILFKLFPDLFTVNERVVLSGKWRWGFFSVTPVGATNVGSIIINFDPQCKTNNAQVDRFFYNQSNKSTHQEELGVSFLERSFRNSSRILQGYPLFRGQEIGGFRMGSSVVLLFEAPVENENEFSSWFHPRKPCWAWNILVGQKIKAGQVIGRVE